MKNSLQLCLLLALYALIGCSGDSHAKFSGNYLHHSKWNGEEEIIRIYKDGDAYFLKEGKKTPIPAKTINEGLEIQGQLISLAGDRETRYFLGAEAMRISDEEADAITMEQKRNDDLCEQLDKEAKLMSAKITDKDEWNKYVQELQKRKPKGCILKYNGMRF